MRNKISNYLSIILLSALCASGADIGQISGKFTELNKYFGSAVSSIRVRADTAFQRNANTFSMATAEYEMKMDVIEPSRGNFVYAGGDSVLSYCQRHNIQLRGHALVLSTTPPAWLSEGGFPPDTVRAILKEYITNVVTHYRGSLYCWDVVNEAFTSYNGTMANTFFYDNLGRSYVDSAFTWAHAADTGAKLFYNEYYTYYASAPTGYMRKMDSTYALFTHLKANGVRLDGLGVQMHMRPDRPIDYAYTKNWLENCASLGIEIHCTELDVALDTPFTSVKLQEQGHIYADVVRLFISEPACRALLVWGISDRYSWIPGIYPGWGAACMLDSFYQPKPALDSVYQVLFDSTGNTTADRPALTVMAPDAQVLAAQLTGNRIGFSVQVKRSARIRLKVCDILGRALWAHDAFTNASHPYSVVWNAGKAASGMYFIKLLYPEGVATKRFTLTK